MKKQENNTLPNTTASFRSHIHNLRMNRQSVVRVIMLYRTCSDIIHSIFSQKNYTHCVFYKTLPAFADIFYLFGRPSDFNLHTCFMFENLLDKTGETCYIRAK